MSEVLKLPFALQRHYLSESKTRRGDREKDRRGERGTEREWVVATWHVWPWGSEAKREWGREWEKEMEGDGERPAMSSLTVHWAAHVSTLHPSSGFQLTHTPTHTGSLLMAFYIHHFPTINACLPTLLMHLSYIYSSSLSCCNYNRKVTECRVSKTSTCWVVPRGQC